MSANESDQSNRLFPAWVEAGTVTALLVPLFYTAGWSYAYHYFERFNLGLMGLSIPKEYFFQYSFWVVRDRFWVFLLALAGYLGAYVLGRAMFWRAVAWAQGKKLESLVRLTPAFLFPIVIFSLFWVFYAFGEQAAGKAFDWQMENDFRSYQRVKVWAEAPKPAGLGKAGKNGFGNAMEKEWEKGCYRLLMRNKDHLFLFYPEPIGGRMPTDIIPSGKIEMVRILTENVSCKEKNHEK